MCSICHTPECPRWECHLECHRSLIFYTESWRNLINLDLKIQCGFLVQKKSGDTSSNKPPVSIVQPLSVKIFVCMRKILLSVFLSACIASNSNTWSVSTKMSKSYWISKLLPKHGELGCGNSQHQGKWNSGSQQGQDLCEGNRTNTNTLVLFEDAFIILLDS